MSVYVAVVRSRSELTACADMRRLGLVAYAPASTHWRRRSGHKCAPFDAPVLPRYVFVWSTDIGRDVGLMHGDVRGFVELLNADGAPLALGGDWLERVWWAQTFGALDYTRSRKPKMTLGQAVRIISGPFTGLVATLQAMNGAKARVRVSTKSVFGSLSIDAVKLEPASALGSSTFSRKHAA